MTRTRSTGVLSVRCLEDTSHQLHAVPRNGVAPCKCQFGGSSEFSHCGANDTCGARQYTSSCVPPASLTRDSLLDSLLVYTFTGTMGPEAHGSWYVYVLVIHVAATLHVACVPSGPLIVNPRYTRSIGLSAMLAIRPMLRVTFGLTRGGSTMASATCRTSMCRAISITLNHIPAIGMVWSQTTSLSTRGHETRYSVSLHLLVQ